jgi:Zinc finger, C3HC4 type (RING finger)
MSLSTSSSSSSSSSSSPSNLSKDVIKERHGRSLLTSAEQGDNILRYLVEPRERYANVTASSPQDDGPDGQNLHFVVRVGAFEAKQLPASSSWSSPQFGLSVTIVGPDQRPLMTRRSMPVKRTVDPVWALSFESEVPNVGSFEWLRSAKMVVECFGHKNVRVGQLAIDLYTLATGPPRYDLPMLDDKGAPYQHGTRGRIKFRAALVHCVRPMLTVCRVHAAGIRPAASSKRGATNPRLVVRLRDDDDATGVSEDGGGAEAPAGTELHSSVCYATLNPRWTELFGGVLAPIKPVPLERFLCMNVQLELHHSAADCDATADAADQVSSSSSSSRTASAAPPPQAPQSSATDAADQAAAGTLLGVATVPLSKYFVAGSTSVYFQEPLMFRGASYGHVVGELAFENANACGRWLSPLVQGVYKEEGVHDARSLVAGLRQPLVSSMNFAGSPLYTPALSDASVLDAFAEQASMVRQRELLLALATSGDVPKATLLELTGKRRSADAQRHLAECSPSRAVRFLIGVVRTKRFDVVVPAVDVLAKLLDGHAAAQRAFLDSPGAIEALSELISRTLRMSAAGASPRNEQHMRDVVGIIATLALHDSMAQRRLADGGVLIVLKDVLAESEVLSDNVRAAAARAIRNLCYGLGGLPTVVAARAKAARAGAFARVDAEPSRTTSASQFGGDAVHNSDALRFAHGIEPLIDAIVSASAESTLQADAFEALRVVMLRRENQETALPILGALVSRNDSPQIQAMALRMMRQFSSSPSSRGGGGEDNSLEASRRLLDAVGIEPFVHLLTSRDAELRMSALHLLKENVIKNASATQRVRQALVEAGRDGIQSYVRLLDASVADAYPDATKMALQLLARACSEPRIAGYVDSTEGGVAALLGLLRRDRLSVQRLAVGILSRVAANCEVPQAIAQIPLAIAYSPLLSDSVHRSPKLAIAYMRLCFVLARRFTNRLREVKAANAAAAFMGILGSASALSGNDEIRLYSEVLRFLSFACIGQPDNKVALLKANILPWLILRVVPSTAAAESGSDGATDDSSKPMPWNRAIALRSTQLLCQLRACSRDEAVAAFNATDLAFLETYLVATSLSTDDVRLRAEVAPLLKLLGYESTQLCHSKMREPPAGEVLTRCRQCLWIVCSACRDVCHKDHTIGAPDPSFSGDCQCGSSDFCHIQKMEKSEAFKNKQAESQGTSAADSSSSSTNTAPDPECTICYDAPKEVALYRCGHIATCHNCANALRQAGQPCPICSKPIDDIVKFFRS